MGTPQPHKNQHKPLSIEEDLSNEVAGNKSLRSQTVYGGLASEEYMDPPFDHPVGYSIQMNNRVVS